MNTHENPIGNTLCRQTLVEGVYRQYYDRLVLYAQRMLCSSLFAEDAVQDVFTHLIQQDMYFMSEAAAANYIFRSVYNRCVDKLRRRQMMQQFEDFFLDEHKTRPMAAGNDILYRELFSIVENRIDRLSPQCRKVFSMKYRDEQSNMEISQQLGLSLKTVENHVYMARNTLRSYLQTYLCS